MILFPERGLPDQFPHRLAVMGDQNLTINPTSVFPYAPNEPGGGPLRINAGAVHNSEEPI